MSTDFLYALLEASNNADDRELLVEIVIEAMGNLNCLECKKCLELLGMTEIAKVLEKNRRPNIAVGELNYMMLNAMKERGFIVSFVEDKEKSVYKVERGIVCENVDKLWN